ncbi:MAG: family 43 glycosylhydrolase, partial [Bacillota bacterium]
EAPYIVEKDDYYYLFLSTGSCCDGASSTYEVKIGRSESLLGPYLDRQGRNIIGSSGSLVVGDGEQFVGNGHNSVIQDDAGDYWMIYHGIDRDDPYLPSGATRRPLMIDKIIWDRNGWPQIEAFRPSETEQEAPYIEED